MDVFLVVIISGATMVVWKGHKMAALFKAKVKAGSLSVEGRQYPYRLSNVLEPYGSGVLAKVSGLDITLPKALPHIFLDAHTGEKGIGHRFFIDPTQRVHLEGDFDRYFQVFVPAGYETLALSILSPDVLQTLLQTSERYDIELEGYHLRLMGHQRIYNRPQREADILVAAQAVLAEIDHRLLSWQAGDSRQASSVSLRVDNDQTVKVGRLALRMSALAVAIGFGVVATAFYAFAVWTQFYSQDETAVWILWLAAVISFPGVPLSLVIARRLGYLRLR
jgi:hypothetical protein